MTTTRSMVRPKRGPHLVLMALYALFILASGSRAVVQIATQFDVAPLAYVLSAVAAVTYVVGWFAIRRAAYGKPRLAEVMLWVELSGVVVIGTLSLVKKDWFPDASVWSDYGGGYGWVPAALPIAALLWLHRTHEKEADA
jgi:RsiW-degrading membrane proteinase PrsW (M82 family)